MAESIVAQANYQIMPDLSADEFAELKTDIAARGVLVPVEYDENGIVLDGHHRIKACHELGITTWPRLIRTGLTEEQKRSHARALNLARRHLTQEQRVKLWADMRAEGQSYRQIAAADGTVAQQTVMRALADKSGVPNGTPAPAKVRGKDGKAYPAQVERRPRTVYVSEDTAAKAESLPEEQREAVLLGEKELSDVKKEQRRIERIEKIAEIAQGNEDLNLAIRYPVLYADPPWQYEHAESESRAIENQYPTMAIDDICALPVTDLATPDAILFLWATSPKLTEALRVVDEWGFTYRTCAVWDKQKIGMGYYFRQQHELLLVATRGNIPVPLPECRPPSIFSESRGEHSAKPVQFAVWIEAMYPELPKIELFCRSPREGWSVWGNQSC